jgi:DNA-binding NarL/FixJ family response regulator
MRQGADAYIPKPIDQEIFLRTVKQLIAGIGKKQGEIL